MDISWLFPTINIKSFSRRDEGLRDKKNKTKKVKCPECGVTREVRVINGIPQGTVCKKCSRKLKFW